MQAQPAHEYLPNMPQAVSKQGTQGAAGFHLPVYPSWKLDQLLLITSTALIFWKRHLRIEAMMTIGISWMNTLGRTLMKRLGDRPRPNPLLVRRMKQSTGKNFPSGLVASALSFWGCLLDLGMIPFPEND